MENKQEICKALLPVLQMTRNLFDLIGLVYDRADDGEEVVFAIFANGSVKRANVNMDSGTAMIMDIIKQIV